MKFSWFLIKGLCSLVTFELQMSRIMIIKVGGLHADLKTQNNKLKFCSSASLLSFAVNRELRKEMGEDICRPFLALRCVSEAERKAKARRLTFEGGCSASTYPVRLLSTMVICPFDHP